MERPAAIVTGASKGIGRAIALRRAREGFDVALAARGELELQAVAQLCEEEGVRAVAVQTDVSQEAQVETLFKTAADAFSRLDLLDDWEYMMGINLRGTFLCSRAAVRAMTKVKSGTIVNISSVVGIKGYANQGGYAASKHGIVGLSKVLAEEGRESGIRVHAICPGGVATDMVSMARPDIDPDELLQPDDVADLVAYLVKLPKRAMVDLVHLRRATSKPY